MDVEHSIMLMQWSLLGVQPFSETKTNKRMTDLKHPDYFLFLALKQCVARMDRGQEGKSLIFIYQM